MKDTILNLMIAHHGLLAALFTLFRDEVKASSPKAESTLLELTWETKKHFFAEETAIFDFVKLENYGILESINQLKDEHIMLLDDLRSFAQKLPNITSGDFDNFLNLLESHRQIEEQKIYPKLDKELPEDQKIQIISRINQIPIKKM